MGPESETSEMRWTGYRPISAVRLVPEVTVGVTDGLVEGDGVGETAFFMRES